MILTIISHTEHYYTSKNKIVGWEPTVREINYLLSIFDRIYHIAPLYDQIPNKANIEYLSDKIHLIPISPSGGKGLIKKLMVLFYMPNIIYKINSYFPIRRFLYWNMNRVYRVPNIFILHGTSHVY